MKTSPFGRVQNRHLVREVRVLAFGNRRTVLSRTSSLHPSAGMHGRAPDRFKVGAAGAPGLGFWHQMSPITFRFAALSPWIYRWVIESEECPAISWTSRSDPPASVIFFAIPVINVLLPE